MGRKKKIEEGPRLPLEVEDKARAIVETKSKQPRFSTKQNFGGYMPAELFKIAELNLPPYGSGPRIRRRSVALNNFWKIEPHMAGVINSVVDIDKNRGWDLVGPKRQVLRYRKILLHDVEAGHGWRHFASKQSESFWTMDTGAIAEVERDDLTLNLAGQRYLGALRNLYHVDPTLCYYTGDPEFPLSYTPPVGREQKWKWNDYVASISMPNVTEKFGGLGYSALSRSVDVVKILYAIYQHDQEQLGARAPRGLMLLHNVGEEQWEDALKFRQRDLDSNEQRYFGGVMTLASAGIDQIDVKLVGLSQLPAGFDIEDYTSLCMFAIALCFGYDPSQFWPVQSGTLGRGRETEIQHREGTSKGGLDFALTFQRELQSILPDTLEFTMEQRDVDGEKLDAQLAHRYAEMVRLLYEAGLVAGYPLLGTNPDVARQRALALLAKYGVIDYDWVELNTELAANDLTIDRKKRDLEEYLERDRVKYAMERFVGEPIVRLRYGNKYPFGKVETIYEGEKRSSIFRGVTLPKARGIIERQESLTGFRGELEVLLSLYENGRISKEDAIIRMRSLVNRYYDMVAMDAISSFGGTLDDELREIIEREKKRQDDFIGGFWENPSVSRLNIWDNVLSGWYLRIVAETNKSRTLFWNLGNRKEHCSTCIRNNGNGMTGEEWLSLNMIPGEPTDALDCGGWNCGCYFTTASGAVVSWLPIMGG